MLISDCRVLVDGGARDAVWGAVAHLVSAFTSSGAQQRRHLSNAAGHEVRRGRECCGTLGPTAAAAGRRIALAAWNSYDAPLSPAVHASRRACRRHPPLPQLTSRTPSVVGGSPSPTTALTTSPSMPWSTASPAAQLQRQISQHRSAQPSPEPTPTPSADFAGAAAAVTASPERRAAATPTPPPVPPSGDSGGDLLALLLQQQAAQRGEGEGGEGGEDGGGGGSGGGGGEPQSPELLHPGADLADVAEEEEEDEGVRLGVCSRRP